MAAAVLLLVAGSRSQTMSAAAMAAHAPGPVAPVLTGLVLGSGHPLPLCLPGRALRPACRLAQAGTWPDAAGSLQTLRLAHDAPVSGLQPQVVALQLGRVLESVSLQFEGVIALERLPVVLDQLCGAAAVDSRLSLEGSGYLRSISWQCPDGDAQFTAMWQHGRAQGALNLTTARGQAWFDGEPLPEGPALAMR